MIEIVESVVKNILEGMFRTKMLQLKQKLPPSPTPKKKMLFTFLSKIKHLLLQISPLYNCLQDSILLDYRLCTLPTNLPFH